MFIQLATKFFLVSGNSEGYTRLNAFDGALLKSGIGNTNLLKASSILPPGCKQIKPVKITEGSFVPCAYTFISSEIPGEIVSASVCVAIPTKSSQPGLIMEFSSPGRKALAEKIIKEMAYEGMKMRGQKVKKLIIKSAQHKVKKIGGAFAGVVLWL